MKTALVIALIAACAYSAVAYCPNLCSGHGTCESGDTCACYKYTGTSRGDHYNEVGAYNAGLREAWTGADCSLRTCPIAYSWSGATPNGIDSTEYATTASTSYTVTFSNGVDLTSSDSYKAGEKIRIGATFETSAVYTIRAAAYGTDMVVTTYESIADGTKVYAAAFEQDSATTIASSAYDANGAHGMLECAGQGLCDRTTGECECFPGYEGEACTRSVCPNSCSGHGICLAAYRLAADASSTYSQAWDNNKHYGCKCDIGFRGPDCSLQECPSDYDPLHGCGGGQCNEGVQDNNSQDCPNKDYSDCTAASTMGGEQRDCSGRGVCDYETGVCKCFAGFYGEACSQQTILI